MNSQLLDLAAVILIGDGALNLLQPRAHTALWDCGPNLYKRGIRQLLTHPRATRGIGLAQIGLGLLLARKAEAAR